MPNPRQPIDYNDYELQNARAAADAVRGMNFDAGNEDYNDYELGNAREAANTMRQMMQPAPQEDYNDYELGNAREAARSIREMARAGRSTDTMMAHVTPGDYVIPRAIIEKDPAILARIKKKFEEEGADYRDHYVGHELNSINPETGQPEFFFKKIFKKAIPILGAIGGGIVGGPWGAAAGAGLGSKLTGASNAEALLSAAGAGVGSAVLGSGSGSIAGKLTQNATTRGVGESLASGTLGKLGTAIGGASIPAITGASQGLTIAGLANSAMAPQIDGGLAGLDTPSVGPVQENLNTSAPSEMALPGSLGNLSGLSDIQRTSQIATQGTEGAGGVSREGQDYFINQIRRRLNTNPEQGLLPIEGSYLNRLGVNYQPGNTRSILEGIARGGLA